MAQGSREIRRRIKSVNNTKKITRAMEMVAASKMKKAQDTALKGKPYADKIYQVVRELASKVDWRQHPLLSPGKESGKSLIILISTNKGLCGGLNTNLFRYLTNWLPKDMDAEFISVGNKGKNIIVKYLARVEGEGALHIKIKDGAVAGVQLQIWEPPRKHHRYILGVDVADGIGQDRSVCDVFRMGTIEEGMKRLAAALGKLS